MSGLIILPPAELGLTSKNAVYRTSFLTGVAQQIGELPASAEKRDARIYVDIVQQGGSIFLNTYTIQWNHVELSTASLELVIAGKVCILPVERVQSLNTGSGLECNRAVNATFSNPICISHTAQESRLANRAVCRDLEKTPFNR
jgi:hypothetical protein